MTEPYKERELKKALMSNISRFLLELGSGFAYVGEEYRLKVGHTEQFIDLLFYNIKLHSYCVIEVKTGTFGAGDIPDEFKSSLPSIEDIELELK